MALHGANLRRMRSECSLLADAAGHDTEASERSGGLAAGLGSISQSVLLSPPPPASRRSTGSRQSLVEAPSFSVQGGTFAEQAVVGLSCEQGWALRYMVEKLPDADASGSKGRHTVLASEGLLYRRPIVLDEHGVYEVHAMCMREELTVEVSSVATQRFEVRPTEVQALQGRHLAELPKQMLRGLVSFAGTTTKAIAPRLESMRRAIARMTNTSEDKIYIKLQTKKSDSEGKRSSLGGRGSIGSVSVSFSVQVGRDDDGRAMAKGATDPSLVECLAEATGLSSKKITVEAAVKSLDAVLLYLEWTFPLQGHDYLDGSCMVYSEDRLLDVVDYRGAQSVNRNSCSSASLEWSAGRGETGSVVHSGDVMSYSGGRHAIIVRLSELPAHATDCFFALSAFVCRNLSKFISPRVRFFDLEDKGHLLCSYNLNEAGCASASVICSLTRERPGGQGEDGGAGGWSVVAYGQTCDGTVRDYRPIEAAIAPVQAKYANWRRRAPLVELSWLWNHSRAFPRASAERQSVVLPLLDLNPELFMHVVSFL